jgi:pilus assembly protein Flp/PilA
MKFFKNLFRDDAGATAIEYGLIAALIAVAAITAMQGLGNELQTTFNTTSSAMAKLLTKQLANRHENERAAGKPAALLLC